MNYEAIDRWNGVSSDQLAHYKYIKKIKIGPFTRYFYSMKDLQAYYNSTKKDFNREDYDDPRLKIGDAKKSIAEARAYINNPLMKLASDFGVVKKKDLKKANNTIDDIETTYKRIKKGINTKNKVQATVATGKFAIKNMFGFSSRKAAKEEYKGTRYSQAVPVADLSNGFVKKYVNKRVPKRSRKIWEEAPDAY